MCGLTFPVTSLVLSSLLWMRSVVHSAVVEEDILCKVSLIAEANFGQHSRDSLVVEDLGQHSRTSFVCDTLMTTRSKKMLPSTIRFDPPNDLLEENSDSLLNNEWYISFPSGWLSTDLPTPVLDVPDGEQVTTVDVDTVERHLRPSNNLRSRRARKSKGRSLLKTKSNETFLLVLVSAQEESPYYTTSEAEDILFGSSSSSDQISAASQFSACSFGGMKVVRYGDGVIEVEVDNDIGYYDKNSIRRAAEQKVCDLFNLRRYCDPADEKGIDHIVYVVPFGLSSDPRYSNGFAYAGVGGTHSVFQGPSFAPQTILHEIGHNFRLGHAGEGDSEYGDSSGQMGSSYVGLSISALKRCFNGWNMWEMGWLQDRQYDADATLPVTVELATFVDYDKAAAGQYVNVRIGDYYATYNIARGMNEDTNKHQDKVIVVQKVPDERISGYYDTELVAALDDTDETTFTVQNYDDGGAPLVIKVCDMVSGPPDYVKLAVGLNADCSDVSAPRDVPDPTRAPVPSPTTAPTVPPAIVPTVPPMTSPTRGPTPVPSLAPSLEPSVSASPSISAAPTLSAAPSLMPSDVPSSIPTVSFAPTLSVAPSLAPSQSHAPTVSAQPSLEPSVTPSTVPSVSSAPSSTPSNVPSVVPSVSMAPSKVPSSHPSTSPTVSIQPSKAPTSKPSVLPSSQPSGQLTDAETTPFE